MGLPTFRLLAVFAMTGVPAVAQTPTANPTTKILAIGTLAPGVTAETRRDIMPGEVRATLRLALAGKIDQWYAKQDGTGVVFMLNTPDVQEAHDLLEALPLGHAKMMTFELIPLGPLVPLRLLLN